MPKRKILGDTIDATQKVLRDDRDQRQTLIDAHMADQHPRGSEQEQYPTNLLEVARNTYVQELMPGDVRVLVTPRNPAVSASARGLERGTNERIIETQTSREIEAAINESMFSSVSVVRAAEETTGPVDVPGLGVLQTSATAVRHIPSNRFVYDVVAERWHQIRFAGDIFTVPLDWAKNFDGFRRSARKKLEPLKLQDVISPESRRTGVDTRAEKEQYMPQTQLYAMWLPMEGDSGKIVTLAPKSWDVLGPDDGVDWDGPEGGPYHLLTYNDVPGEIGQIPPLELLSPMNSLANTAMRKIKARVERSKEVGLVAGEEQELADKIKDALDGAWFNRGAGRADPVEMVRVGGIGGELVGVVIQARNFLSWLGGGIELMGGMRASSPTLGQDRILSEAASKRMRAMAKRVEAFTRGIVRALAWYEWTDPIRERVFMDRIEQRGITYEIPLAWTPATRMGNFLDHDVQVDVYAFQHRSPEERASVLMQNLGAIMPLYPILQAQGGQIDVAALARLLARLRDLPEQAEVIRVTTDQQTPIELQAPPERARGERPTAKPRDNGDEALVARLMGGGAAENTGERP